MEYFNLVGNPPKINSPYSSHYTQKLLPNRMKQRSLIQDIDIPLDLMPDYSLPSIYKETYILREVNEMYDRTTSSLASSGESSSTSFTTSFSSGTGANSGGKRAASASTSASASDTSYLTDSRIPNPLTPHVSALQQAMVEQADENGGFELDYFDDDEEEVDDEEEEAEEDDVVLLIDDLTRYTEFSKATQGEKGYDPSSEQSSSNGSDGREEDEGEHDIDLSKLFSGQQKRAKKTEDRNKSTFSSTTSITTTSTSTTPSAVVSSVSAKVTNKQRLSSILVRLADRPVAVNNNTTSSSSTSKGVVSIVGKEKTVETSAK